MLEIVKRKGHTAFAIGKCVGRVCGAVLRNERTPLAVSTLLQGEYDIEGDYTALVSTSRETKARQYFLKLPRF